MDGDIDLNKVPLLRLSNEAKNLLSSLLNTTKVLRNVCPDRISRYRDWRGLASLVNISTQVEVSIKEYPDKFGKVLEIWLAKDSDATVGQLMQYLQQLDRFDVYDDLTELAESNKLLAPPPSLDLARVDAAEDDRITFQDVQYNSPQQYHAYVLYAPQDREFVYFMLNYLRGKGLQLCTEEDLLPGFATRFEPVARLIAERCRRIVLVYSPAFFQSSAVQFITHFAQAHGVETNIRNLVPIMYRYCSLPPLLAHYHNLVYPQHGLPAGRARLADASPADLDPFWKRLESSLHQPGVPRLRNGTVSSESSGVKIQLVSSTLNGYTPREISPTPREDSVTSYSQISRFTPQKKDLLPLPEPNASTSGSAVSLPESLKSSQSESSSEVKEPKSMMDISQETISKKKNKMQRFLGQFRLIPSKIGKKKKVIMVEN